MNLDKLKEITDQVGDAIALEINKELPEEVAGQLSVLANLQANAAYAQALAGMLYNQKIADLVESNQFKGLSATDKKMVFAGRAKQEIFYVDLTERQSRSLSHSIDAYRSILSFLKTEVTNTNNY